MPDDEGNPFQEMDEGNPFQEMEASDEFNPSVIKSKMYEPLEGRFSGYAEMSEEELQSAAKNSLDAGLDLEESLNDLEFLGEEAVEMGAGDILGPAGFVLGCLMEVKGLTETLQKPHTDLQVWSSATACIPVVGQIMQIVEFETKQSERYHADKKHLEWTVNEYEKNGDFPEFRPPAGWVEFDTRFKGVLKEVDTAYDQLERNSIAHITSVVRPYLNPVIEEFDKKAAVLGDEMLVYSGSIKDSLVREAKKRYEATEFYKLIQKLSMLAGEPDSESYYYCDLESRIDVGIQASSFANQNETVGDCLNAILHEIAFNEEIARDFEKALSDVAEEYAKHTQYVSAIAAMRESQLIEKFDPLISSFGAKANSQIGLSKTISLGLLDSLYKEGVKALHSLREKEVLIELNMDVSGRYKGMLSDKKNACWKEFDRGGDYYNGLAASDIMKDYIKKHGKYVYGCKPFVFNPDTDEVYLSAKKSLDGRYSARKFTLEKIYDGYLSGEVARVKAITQASLISVFKKSKSKDAVQVELDILLKGGIFAQAAINPDQYIAILDNIQRHEHGRLGGGNVVVSMIVRSLLRPLRKAVREHGLSGKQRRRLVSPREAVSFFIPQKGSVIKFNEYFPWLASSIEGMYGKNVTDFSYKYDVIDLAVDKIVAVEIYSSASTIEGLVFEMNDGEKYISGKRTGIKERVSFKHCPLLNIQGSVMYATMHSIIFETDCGISSTAGGTGGEPFLMIADPLAMKTQLRAYWVSTEWPETLMGLKLTSYGDEGQVIRESSAGTVDESTSRRFWLSGSGNANVNSIEVYYADTVTAFNTETVGGALYSAGRPVAGVGSVVEYSNPCPIVGFYGNAGDAIDKLGLITKPGCRR